MGIIGVNPSIKMAGLGRRFQTEGNKYMVAESFEEYSLVSVKAYYNNPEEKSSMTFMALGGEFDK